MSASQIPPATTPVTGSVTANAGTDLNTSTLALETGGNLAAIKADVDKIPALGQALAASSVPVVLTAAQLTTLTPPAAIAGFATETTLGTRLSESDFDGKTGSVTETAPATDTASSGLNGRLQRIAQRITSLIAAIGSPFQAGGSIGNTSFAATQATAASLNATVVGTGTFATQPTLQAGSAIVGKVGIDQTTPGTTNGVQVNAALPAGSNVIGHVIADSGSTTAVTGTVTVSGAVTEATLDAALISQEANTSSIKGLTAFGAVTSAAPSYTTAKSDALSIQTNGSLRTAITDALPAGSNVIGHVVADAGSTTAVTQGTATNLKAQAEAYQGGTAVSSSNPLSVTLANTGGNATALLVTGTGGTFPVSGTVSANLLPTTSGGLLDYHLVAAATTNAQNVKASAGQLYGVRVFNNAAYPVYVKFHNTSGTPTAGSGVVKTVGVQAGTACNIEIANGMAFGTGIGISIVKDITDAGTTAVALSDCVVDVEYK